MSNWITCLVFAAILVLAELAYFKIADKCNIIDKPNQRSSHTQVVLRGGGVIFLIGLWIWSFVYGFEYPWLLAGVTLAAGLSFWDDIHSLPDLPRLMAHLIAVAMMLVDLDLMHLEKLWMAMIALLLM